MIANPRPRPLADVLPEPLPLLMGAGPVPIPDSVARANTMVINHIGENMNNVIQGLVSMAQYVFQTQTNKIFGISGPASGAMEMAVASLLWPGRSVLVLNLGTFSARFAEIARGVGAEVTELFPEPLAPFRAEIIRRELSKKHFDVLTIVHGETSCGIKNVELREILQAAKDHGALTLVDSVTTVSTMPVEMDNWGIDVMFTGGQKGFSCVAGIALIAFSEKAFEVVMKREPPMHHWCLDPRRAYRFWVMKEYHYTAPVNAVLAMYEALRLICEETLEKRFQRHQESSLTLQRCLEVLGLELYAPAACRLNSVLAVKNKNNIVVKDLLTRIRKLHGVELSGAFGLDIFRIGQMGEQCRPENLRRTLMAIAEAYEYFGVKLDLPSALGVFQEHTKLLA